MRPLRAPNGDNTKGNVHKIYPDTLLNMSWADNYFYVTTAGVVRKAAAIWAERNDQPLGGFAEWFRELSDNAPVTVRGYNGHGIWDVQSV